MVNFSIPWLKGAMARKWPELEYEWERVARLAKMTGISVNRFNAWLTGRQTPRLKFWAIVSDALDGDVPHLHDIRDLGARLRGQEAIRRFINAELEISPPYTSGSFREPFERLLAAGILEPERYGKTGKVRWCGWEGEIVEAFRRSVGKTANRLKVLGPNADYTGQ